MPQFKVKFLSLIFLLFLTSCDGADTWCWESNNDSYSSTNTLTTTVDNYLEIWAFSAPYANYSGGYGIWVDTGFKVTEGLEYQISVPSGTGDQIIIASDYESDANNGLGVPYVIAASNGNPTLITDSTTGEAVVFALNQTITVTNPTCTTGTDSYGSTSPTKWTWDNNWLYSVVNCTACPVNPWPIYNGFTNYDCSKVSADCIGSEGCNCTDLCSWMGFSCKTCNDYYAWGCIHNLYSFTSTTWPYVYGFTSTDSNGNKTNNPYTYYDVCPESQYATTDSVPPANLFVCQYQSGVTTGDSAYAESDPTYDGSGGGPMSSQQQTLNNSGWCDGGYQGAAGDWYSWSHSNPGCDDITPPPTQDFSTESIHMTGNVDTCWNTGGYQLYAIQEGIQCPPSVDNRCLSMAGGYVSNGSGEYVYNYAITFSSMGGNLWLEIINPNATMPQYESDIQDDINTNNTSISSYENQNNTLYDTVTNDLIALNNYYTSNQVTDMVQQGYTLNETGAISDPTAQQYMTNITNYLDGYSQTTVTTNADGSTETSIGAFINGLSQSCSSLDTVLNQADPAFQPDDTSSWEPYVMPTSYDYADEASWTPTTYPDSTVASDIYDLAGNAIVQSNALITYLTLTSTYTPPTLVGSTTSQDLLDYCNSTITTLQEMQGAVYTVESTQAQIDYNNNQITTLTDQNNEYYQEILDTNSFDNTGMVGGYTAYVAAGPLSAMYGQYLKAIIVQNNENPNSALTSADNDPTLFETIFDYSQMNAATAYPMMTVQNYTSPQTGEVWMKIFDPDDNYYNNSQSYVVNFAAVQTTSGFSTMLSELIALIQGTVNNAAENIYLGTTCYKNGQDRTTQLCLDYINSINILLKMYVIIFGIMYLFGLIKTDYVDFIMRIVKIAVVSMLLQPYSYDYFNQYLFNGFYGLTNTLISAATGAPTSNPFDFITQTVNVILLDQTTYFKVIGLLFQGLLGIVAFILLIYGCMSFMVAFFDAFIVYMTSFIGMAMCVALAPIFIIFILFEKTRHLFENWFKTMVKLTLIPVILLIGLILLNGMLASILQSLFNYAVCYKCTFPITFAIPGFPQVGTITLFCVSWFSKWGADNVGSAFNVVLMSFPLAINFCIITEVMRIYSGNLAFEIASGLVGSSSVFKGSDKSASLGMNPFAGIQKGFKSMDKQVEKFAVRSGIAQNRDEYKTIRNRMLGIEKKKPTPPAPNTNLTPKSATNTSSLQEQEAILKQKREAVVQSAQEPGISKNEQKRLNKKAAKLQDKIDHNGRKQNYSANNSDAASRSMGEMEAKLARQSSRAQESYAKFEAVNRDKTDDPNIAKTRERLYQMSVESARRLNNFKTNPQAFMQDEQQRESTAQAEKAKEARSYEVLGISKSHLESLPLSEQDRLIKSTYRKLAKTHHPDKAGNTPEATAKFKEISNANMLITEKYEQRRDNNIQPRKPKKAKKSSEPSAPPQGESANPAKEAERAPSDPDSSKATPNVESERDSTASRDSTISRDSTVSRDSTASRDSSSSADSSPKSRSSSMEDID